MFGIRLLYSRGTTVADPALAAMDPQHVSVRSVTPAAGNADNTGRKKQRCVTPTKDKFYECNMCGEHVLHNGNFKLHENCRSLPQLMGDLHYAPAQRWQKRAGVESHYAFSRLPRRKMPKTDDHRPPLPPPYQLPVDDSDSTDEDMPALVDNPYVSGDTTLCRAAAERAFGCSRGDCLACLAEID